MTERRLTLDPDPAAALAALRDASRSGPVVVFKKSPTCPVSHRAEWEFKSWLRGLADAAPLRYALIDVIAERPLARGLTELLAVKHESPQALWFERGELTWHDSHDALTQARFEALATEARHRG